MISNAYAMAPTPGNANNPGGGAFGMFIPLLVIFGIFYFLIIRPQRKKDSEHKKFLSELQKGTEVMTQSGILGRIASIEENVVTLDLGNQVKIRVIKSSIAGSVTAPGKQA